MIAEKRIPANVEMEQSVLATIMSRMDMLALVRDSLQPCHMTDQRHHVIYSVLLDLYDNGHSTDVTSVIDRLEQTGRLREAGGASYLHDLASMAFSVPGMNENAFENHAKAIHDKWTYRALLETTACMAQWAYDEEPQALDLAEEALLTIRQGTADTQIVGHAEAAASYVDTLRQQFAQGPDMLMGVPSGFARLDKKTGGFRKAKLYMLAGRPGDGKTAMALNIADYAVKHEYKVLFFSLEMDREELMQRWFGMEAGIDTMKIRDNELTAAERAEVLAAGRRLGNLKGNLWIDDTCGLSSAAIRSKVLRTQAKHGLDLVIIDYLQLAKATKDAGRRQDRRLEVEEVSRDLKVLARTLGIPVLALAQQNREIEKRADKKPQMSDFRDGALENDADVCMFVRKAEDVEEEATGYAIDLYIVKNRSGKIGVVPLYYNASLTKFFPGEGSHASQYA